MDKQIVISLKTILLTFLLVLAGYVVYRLGPVIGLLVVATLIVVSIEPLIKRLIKLTLFNRPLNRSVAVILAYVFLILILTLVVTLGIPPVINELQRMILSLSQTARELNITNNVSVSLSDFLPQATNFSSEFLSVTLSLFSNLTTVFSLFIISIYLSLDWINIKKRLISFFPNKAEEDAVDAVAEIEQNIGQWVKGQLILMLVVGVLSYIGLTILGVRYALALAIVSGILEIIPMIGPLITAVIGGILGFSQDPVLGIGVLALFTLIQQLENNILVPKIMQKVSGFSPLIILLALLIGSEFFGVIGALLAVPMTMILTIVLKRVLRDRFWE